MMSGAGQVTRQWVIDASRQQKYSRPTVIAPIAATSEAHLKLISFYLWRWITFYVVLYTLNSKMHG